MRCLLLLFCLQGIVFCQQLQIAVPEGVYRPGKDITSPKIASQVDPEYSDEARIARLSGTVRVSLIVGEDGNVRDAHAVSSPGLGLSEKAIQAVRSWKFTPGRKDGLPVAVALQAEVNFSRGVGRGKWALARAFFVPAEGTARPVLTSAPYSAPDSTTGPGGTVSISFDVQPDGTAANLHVEKSSNSALEEDVIRIVRGWEFQPGTNHGEAVSVRCTMDFIKESGSS